MFSKGKVGFNITLIGVMDKTHNDQVQLSGDALSGSSAEQLAHTLDVMNRALWIGRLTANDRQLALSERLSELRDQRVAEFKAAGRPVDDDMIEDERRTTNAVIIRQRSEVDAARAVLGCGDPTLEPLDP